MSFDDDHPNRKDWRKPYRGAKERSVACRNHKSCSYCRDTRTYNRRRTAEAVKIHLLLYFAGQL